MNDTSKTTELTITIAGLQVDRIERDVAEQLTDRLRNGLDDKLTRMAEQALGSAVDSMMRERCKAELERVLEEGWRKTDTYGNAQGPKVTLRERIGEILLNKQSNYSSQHWLDETVKREVQSLLAGPFKEEIAKAQASFRVQVDSLLTGKIAEGLRKALGLQ
jgi:uncharacterized membrane protein YheB (UPF0754 family)